MNWSNFIKEEMKREYFQNLIALVKKDATQHEVYPARENIFKAFSLCPFEATRVCILGMDPYINPGQAMGLSFSVPVGVDFPPSLRNIFKELETDLGIKKPVHGDLTGWARQGILLMNSILTVRRGATGSHADFGWQTFTDKVIALLNEKEHSVVFVLWGAQARKKQQLITNDYHLVLESAHPSPLSAHNGFFGSKPFSKINNFLISNDEIPIDWGSLK
jgi:uracil-DNA glycosylase